MSTTAFISHPSCQLHEMGEFYPESPHRIQTIQNALIQQGLADFIQKVPSQKVPIDLLVKTHSQKHVDAIKQYSPTANHYYAIDDDTQMNQYSFEASLYAAGSGGVALDGIFDNQFNNAFCGTRPPNHDAVKIRRWFFVCSITLLLLLLMPKKSIILKGSPLSTLTYIMEMVQKTL